MKIFFNRVPRNEPYGGGNQFLIGITSLLESSGFEVVYHLEKDVDLIFMMDPRPGDIGYSIQHIFNFKRQFPETKVIHRVNECDKRKGTKEIDDLLLAGMNLSDRVIFISEWLKQHFREKGYKGNSDVIYNGCNLDHFFPEVNKKPSRNLRLVTHHWSDNWMKGFDLYNRLDRYITENPNSGLEFTYIGRYFKDYTPVSTKIVSPTFGKDLGDKIREHDVYVTASRFEPCGMHHIEGSASGLPVLYHRDGGGINELCTRHGIEFDNFEEFLEAVNVIKDKREEYQAKIDYPYLSLDRCLSEYLKVIKEMA